MNPMKFTQEDSDTLIRLWNEGHPTKDIAMAMGRTHNNIRNKVKALQQKGDIRPREKSNGISDEEIQHLSGVYQLPIDVVQFLASQFSGGATRILGALAQSCEAYIEQNGYCYYLHGRVKLTMDNSPSGVAVMQGPAGKVILTCNAIANTRKTMSHEGFVGLCKAVAQQFT